MKIAKIVITVFVVFTFLFYAYTVSFELFFIRPWLGQNRQSLVEYLRFNSNFIPFSEISRKIGEIINGCVMAPIARRNLFGNLFLFTPMGFYLPYFWNKMSQFKIYALSTAVLAIAVEAIQLITRSGIVDIDDFILNFAGALLGFAIFKYTPIRHLFKWRAY